MVELVVLEVVDEPEVVLGVVVVVDGVVLSVEVDGVEVSVLPVVEPLVAGVVVVLGVSVPLVLPVGGSTEMLLPPGWVVVEPGVVVEEPLVVEGVVVVVLPVEPLGVVVVLPEGVRGVVTVVVWPDV